MSVQRTQWLPEYPAVEARKTFVLWLSREASPTLEGRLEDVDTGQQVRFRSAEQLIAFLEQCIRTGETDE